MSGSYVDKYGNPTEELIKKYSEATGLMEDEIRGKIEAKTLSAETMAQTIATDQITEINSLRMRKTA
jgi:hypothetical protein